MTLPIQRISDSNDAGGVIDSVGQSIVTDGGLLVSINNSVGTSHPPCPLPTIHCSHVWVTTSGSSLFRINGIPVNFQTNPDSCGHVRVAGSPRVSVQS